MTDTPAPASHSPLSTASRRRCGFARQRMVISIVSKCSLTPQYSGELAPGLPTDRTDSDRCVPCSFSSSWSQSPQRRGDPDVLLHHLPYAPFRLHCRPRPDVPSGPDRHPLFAEADETPGPPPVGPVAYQWNFEEFLLAPGGTVAKAVPSAHRTGRPRGGSMDPSRRSCCERRQE